MKNIFKFLVGLLFALSYYYMPCFAQKGKTRHIPNSQIVLSGYGGLTINNMNVINNNIYPDPFRVPAAFTFNPKVALDFQRTTKYRMIWGFGIEYGKQRQDFDLVYPSFDFVDATQGLRNSSASFSYRNKANYLGARFTIGYLFPIKDKSRKLFDIETKLTAIKTFVFDGGEVYSRLVANYISGDTIYLREYDVMRFYGLWGDRGLPMGGFLFMELNIGIRKYLNWLRNDVYMGIYSSGSSLFFSKIGDTNSDIYARNGHYLNGQFQYYDTDYFAGKDFTVGLKLGIGLKL